MRMRAWVRGHGIYSDHVVGVVHAICREHGPGVVVVVEVPGRRMGYGIGLSVMEERCATSYHLNIGWDWSTIVLGPGVFWSLMEG